MQAISLSSLNYYLNYFNRLKKAGLTFVIDKHDIYVPATGSIPSHYQLQFVPLFKDIKTIRELADIWMAAPTNLSLSAVEDFSGLSSLEKNESCVRVNANLFRTMHPAIKYYAASVFDPCARVRAYLINKKVPETTVNKNTIRYVLHGNKYNSGELIYCADQNDQHFNYIDPGHIVVFASTGEPSEDSNRMFVTDAITLDMNYIIALASVYPAAIDGILQHKSFIPSKDCRMLLLKAERSIPAKLRGEYMELKQNIQGDFSKSTTSVMIGKLTRKESPFIEINNIRVTSTRAEYAAGNVSIEADNLAEVVFAKLNPNETEWDIFTLINIYTDWVNDQFKLLELNTDGTGFRTAKEFEFSINDIPLKVECFTENTRRAINGHMINVDELSAVLKRAACYQIPENGTDEDNVQNFDKFIRSVSRYSLKLRDIWSNGLPVKTLFLESDRSVYNIPATAKHPKLRFVLKDKKGFHLQVNVTDPKTKKVTSANEYRIGKFAQFVHKVEMLNKRTNMSYYGDYERTAEGYYVPRSGSNMSTALLQLLTDFAEGITDEDKKSIVGSINFELGEAEKRSEELLKEACDITGTKTGTRDNKPGYIVPGKMRTYFVEAESPFKVWDNNPAATNPYFCVVNKGDMGVGKDALVARIFALHNDQMMAKSIHTLNR